MPLQMNLYAVIILVAIGGAYLLELIARLLNLRSLDSELPEEFRNLCDADRYHRSQRYTRARTVLGLVESTVALVALLAFWFWRGFQYLDGLVRDLAPGPVSRGLLFIGILVLGSALLRLPFRCYSIFVTEERFGFNRTTPSTFLLDTCKSVALAILLGGPLLALILAFFEYASGLAWLYCWLAASAFVVTVQIVYPTWILPWFNKLTPLEEGSLRRAILEYAEKVGFPLAGIYVIDGSRRSSKANAFFTGLGRRKRIALFDTLIERHTEPELVAVLAHEVGHCKRGHVVKMTAISILQLGVLFGLLSLFLREPALHEAFYVDRPSVYAGLVFFSLLYTPLQLVLSLGINLLSRRHEYEADHFAVETTGNDEAMVAALKRLAVDNLVNLTPHPLLVFLEASHPPVLQRIRAIAAG